MKHILTLLLTSMLLLSCKNEKQHNSLTDNNLASKIEYGEAMVNKVIFEGNYKMILFALKKGQDLKPHSAPMDAPMIMLNGSAKVTIGDKEIIAYEGDIITLPKDIDHGVYPITDCKFLLMK